MANFTTFAQINKFCMNEYINPDSDNLSNEEKEYEKALRPDDFGDFFGQPKVVENLEIFVQAAKQRGEALDHVLLHGPPGLGKTTLSHIMIMMFFLLMKSTD